ESTGGYIFKTIGDEFCAAFENAGDAVSAALRVQHDIIPEDSEMEIRVRIAIHCGSAQIRDGDYFGEALNRVNRILGAANGGQIFLSASAESLIHGSLPAGT